MKITTYITCKPPPLYWFIYGRIARHIYNLNNSQKITVMTLEKFVTTVKKMRGEQKKWFLFKDKNALKQAIRYEKIIDEELKSFMISQPEEYNQIELFKLLKP